MGKFWRLTQYLAVEGETFIRFARPRRLSAGFLGSVFGVVLILSTTPSAVSAHELSAGQTIGVTAIVAPHIYIVAGSHNEITQIVSNTSLNIAPTVSSGSVFGQPLTMTANIANQYSHLQNRLVLRAGVIYRQPKLISRANRLALFKSSLFNMSFWSRQ